MEKLALNKQTSTLLAIFILLLLGFFLLAWRPQTARIVELNEEKLREEKALQAATNTYNILKDEKKDYVDAKIELVKIATKMPAEPEVPSLVVELQNMANDAGVELKSIRTGEIIPQGEFSEVRLNVSVVGSYVSLVDFLKRTEKAARALKNHTVEIKVVKYPDLNLNIAISAYTMGAYIRQADQAVQGNKPSPNNQQTQNSPPQSATAQR